MEKQIDDSQILLDSFRSAQLLCDGTRESLHKWWRHEYNLMYTEYVNEKSKQPAPTSGVVDLLK